MVFLCLLIVYNWATPFTFCKGLVFRVTAAMVQLLNQALSAVVGSLLLPSRGGQLCVA